MDNRRSLYPVTPQNLTTEPGMDNVYLSWEGAQPTGRSLAEMQHDREARAEYHEQKKPHYMTGQQKFI